MSLNASLQREFCTSRLWEDLHKFLQCSRRYNKRWVGSTNISAQKKSKRKVALKFLGHCEFRRKMKYWGSRSKKKKEKKVIETLTKSFVGFFFFLFRECDFHGMNKHHHWLYVVNEISIRTEDCWRQTTAAFHGVMRKEQEELSWAQVTHISSSSVSF